MHLFAKLVAAFRMGLVLAAFGLALAPVAAMAQSMEAPLARLADDSFPETAKAIEEIARTGAPEAVTILEAMGDRRLLVDPATKTVAIKDASGKLIDARTMKALAAAPAGLAP